MDPALLGYTGLIVMLALISMGVHISFAMAIVGIVGTAMTSGLPAALSQIDSNFWTRATDMDLLCIPLFIFMGQLCLHTGIVSKLYESTRAWVGHLPGGLAIASVFACGAFGAVTGSTIAATATMGGTVIPELKKYHYKDNLAAGTLASGGGLAALIPPSVVMVFYGLLTDTSIAALFMAGFIPGILLMVLYSTMIYARCIVDPELGPRGPVTTLMVKIQSLRQVWPVLVVFLTVIGSIYAGICTPTEAAGAGGIAVLIIAKILKSLTWKNFKEATHETGVLTAMVFLLIVGGYLIARFLAITGITDTIIQSILGLGVNRYIIIGALLLLYLVLGCVLDSFGMLILTLPFTFPVVSQLGFDPVWFGIWVVMVCEMGLVTPPVGLSVYVLKSVAPDIEIREMFRGVGWFLFCMIALAVILIAFPDLATWLPRLLIG